MAKQIVETFIDDIDGSDADGTTTFALDGATYEIDLSGANREKLEKALAPFIVKARKVPRTVTTRATRTGRPTSGRDRTRAIRAWAHDHGIQVAGRGRIAEHIVKQYEDAN